MNVLIHPAVTLMNRLPMLYKFGLISVLFLLPIIALSWLVISGLNQSVQTMNRGVEGLQELRKVKELFVAAVEYRDYQAPAVLKQEPGLVEKADAAAQDLGIFDLPKELLQMIGRLHFRTSYG
ncbi:MAG: hypothetical protein B7X58_10675, partial [Marinobacter sp. 34-60-7]